MTKQAEIELAKTYAAIAYAKGKTIPAHDKDLLSMLDGKKVGEGLHILRAYSAEITRLHAADFNAAAFRLANS